MLISFRKTVARVKDVEYDRCNPYGHTVKTDEEVLIPQDFIVCPACNVSAFVLVEICLKSD